MATEAIERIIRLQVTATQALAEMEKVARASQKIDTGVQGMVNGLGSAVDRIKNVAGVVGAAFAAFKGAQAITDAGDKVRQLEGSFTALLGSAERSRDMLQQVFEVAQTTGAGVDDVSGATQRLSIALADAGATNNQIAQIAENFVMIGRVGGSSMQDVSGALVQFTQALASGKLQGDELRSILERMPLLAQLLAKEMGVPVGQLKELGSQGKITADVMTTGLLRASEQIREQFDQLPTTLEQSMNRVQTTAMQLLAGLDDTAGISKTIATILDYVGGLLAACVANLKDGSGEMTTWQVLGQAIGNAFRGIVIVVNTVASAVAGVLVALKGVGEALRAITSPSQWGDIGRIASETAAQVGKIASSTMDFNRAIALGEPLVRSGERATRDWKTGLDKLEQNLKNNATATTKAGKAAGAAKAPKLDDWDKWLQTLQKATAELEMAPRKLAYLNDELERLERAGDTTSARFLTLRKAADELAASIDPVAAALQRIANEAREQGDAELIMAGIRKRMEEMAAAGKMATLEFRQMGIALDELAVARDTTGGLAVVRSLQEQEAELGKLQAKFDAVNAAVEQGVIRESTAEDWKRKILGISDAADRATEKTKTLAQAVGEAGAKFVTDFADKLFINRQFQQLLQMAQQQSGQGGLWGWIGQLIGGVASGSRAAPGLVGEPFTLDADMGSAGRRITRDGFMAGAAQALSGGARVSASATTGLAVQPAPVAVQVNNYAGAEVSTTSATNADGSRLVQVEIRRQVRNALSDGSMDRTLRANYGVTRQPAIG